MAVIVPHVLVRHLTTNPTTDRVSFGIRDKRGREVGAILFRYGLSVDLAQGEEARFGLLATTELPVGASRLVFVPHATRDGKAFGACQRHSYFETDEAREAAIAKYLAGAKKRAAKMAGGAS